MLPLCGFIAGYRKLQSTNSWKWHFSALCRYVRRISLLNIDLRHSNPFVYTIDGLTGVHCYLRTVLISVMPVLFKIQTGNSISDTRGATVGLFILSPLPKRKVQFPGMCFLQSVLWESNKIRHNCRNGVWNKQSSQQECSRSFIAHDTFPALGCKALLWFSLQQTLDLPWIYIHGIYTSKNPKHSKPPQTKLLYSTFQN